jgi:hypothetical protein
VLKGKESGWAQRIHNSGGFEMKKHTVSRKPTEFGHWGGVSAFAKSKVSRLEWRYTGTRPPSTAAPNPFAVRKSPEGWDSSPSWRIFTTKEGCNNGRTRKHFILMPETLPLLRFKSLPRRGQS